MTDARPPRSSRTRLGRAAAVTTLALALLLNVRVSGEDFVLERFGTLLDSVRIQAGIPALAAAIIGSNDIIWERAYGRQDLDRFLPARTDTPFHTDGLTQVFTAAMVLRCVEEGRLSLDDRVGTATIGQLLTHTSETAGGLVYSYRPERLEPLSKLVRDCNGGSFRKTLAINVFEQYGMVDSVPGPDAPTLAPPAEGIPTATAAQRYLAVLDRLATPYAVDNQGHASPARYTATTLTPATGVISTVRDFARFDVALRNGYILKPSTLAEAWQAPIGANKQRLPHGFGWFVQTYNNVPIVWQFGAGDNGSSSLVVTLRAQKLTLILMANSTGLVKASSAPLSSGDLAASPFGQMFLNVFAR
jgi:CubicO group peptidase (beta-lactamase class C family)